MTPDPRTGHLREDELVQRVIRDSGDLIVRIVVWPPGLGVDVHLVGGAVVQHFPSGQRYPVDKPSVLALAIRRADRAHGAARRLAVRICRRAR